jgi:hypothetical protein
VQALAAVADAMGRGVLSAEEAQAAAAVLEHHRRSRRRTDTAIGIAGSSLPMPRFAPAVTPAQAPLEESCPVFLYLHRGSTVGLNTEASLEVLGRGKDP